MNRKLLPIVAAIVLLIIGGFAFVLLQSDDERLPSSTPNPNNSANPGTSPPTADPAPTTSENTSSAGIYTEYDQAKLAATTGTRILFFHAPWCPQCRALDASIKAGEVPAGVTILKVDYDSNQALRQKYGVTIQTTLVKLDAQGNVADKYVAYDEPNLAAVKSNLLQ